MKNIKLIPILLIVLSSALLGCVQQKPVGTSVRTPAPTEIADLTVVPTVSSPGSTPIRVPTVYKVDVEDIYGFTKVVSNSMELIPYDLYNRTLTLNAGDTVVWVNDAEDKLTIVSEQGLWDNTSAILRWRYKEFNYTFTKPGTYGVYIKEEPRILHQKIIVKL